MPYRPQAKKQERLVIGIWGDAKTGKTHFCLTAPQPLYLINTDHGFVELLGHDRFADIDILAEDITEDISAGNPGSFEAAQSALAKFHKVYVQWLEAIGETGRGTIIVDNASFLWELVQYVKLEEAKRARFAQQSKVKNYDELRDQRFDYGPVNHYYNVMMRAIYNTPGSLILTHSAKNKYNERGEETSELQMQGFRATANIVQAVCQTYKDGRTFKLAITHSRHRPDQEGLWIPDPSFDSLANVLLS